ncbi:dihydroxyacetone kinase [Cylindrobasidium torrendii FP15055 ss-10]|uniref:Dihydroxyacetone kinase n=1 Tax=Cylindrobasidium torrendii FP15055 ss-10 TaxID=1314674 RepID=A0A0D7B3H1_9AGAR|nr:dihydroxyacetone kinase [Cylindrobasidium torrendii FP15055 ss-10]
MSLQKHLINDPADLVVESLKGLCTLNHQLSLDVENKIVYQANQDTSKVAVICGGGSGHEPAHGSFVGEGLLTAAVCGNVFASPNTKQVRHGIDLVNNDAGNYTGDVLNFGLAKEQYAAELHKTPIKFLVVGDDVAVGKTQGGIVGRRGMAGVVLTYKVAGAAAAKGASLDEVYNVAEWVAGRIGTIGVGLEHCHVPGTATSEAHLGLDEVEVGLGIHNESGNKRLKPVPKLNELVPQLIDLITSNTDKERGYVPFKNDGSDEVVVFINNLGGFSELELGAFVGSVTVDLSTRKIKVVRAIAGTFITSLNMPGVSVSLLLLPKSGESGAPKTEDLLSYIDAKANAPGWKWTSPQIPNDISKFTVKAETKPSPTAASSGVKVADPKAFIENITRACDAVVAAEPEITRMDTIAGDGDCGLTLKGGADSVKAAVKAGEITGEDIIADMVVVAKIAAKDMGGTSGALYSIFFSGLAQALKANASAGSISDDVWKKSLGDALDKLYTYTRARPPSRTLIDPLAGFIKELGQGWPAAVQNATKAAEYTKEVDAKAGRSAYVDSSLLQQEKVPDPGAWGVMTILQALFK